MLNLKRMGLTPAKPAWDWEEVENGNWDGAFKGTPASLLPTVRHFFRAQKFKAAKFDSGDGFIVKTNIDQLVTLRPSKKMPNATIIEIQQSKRGPKDFVAAREAFLHAGIAMSEPKDFNDWQICGALSPVSQKQWNRIVRPLFDEGWTALMVHGVQQVKRGPVTINYVPESRKHVAIIFFH